MTWTLEKRIAAIKEVCLDMEPFIHALDDADADKTVKAAQIRSEAIQAIRILADGTPDEVQKNILFLEDAGVTVHLE